jgi:hypothetical protein
MSEKLEFLSNDYVLVDGEIQVLILVPDAMSEKLEFLSNDYVLVDGEIQVLILKLIFPIYQHIIIREEFQFL